jgi:hypothetical protein
MKFTDISTVKTWIKLPPALMSLPLKHNPQTDTKNGTILVYLEDDLETPYEIRITLYDAAGPHHGMATLEAMPHVTEIIQFATVSFNSPLPPTPPMPSPHSWLNQEQADGIHLSADNVWRH